MITVSVILDVQINSLSCVASSECIIVKVHLKGKARTNILFEMRFFIIA